MGGVILVPYYHCRRCQHEFEAIQREGIELKCDWCGADKPRILEEQTPLEKMCDHWEEILEPIVNQMKERTNGDIR